MGANDNDFEWRIVWHSVLDKRRCKKCIDLESYEWFGVGLPPPILIHPVHGEAWDAQTNRSLTHERDPHIRYECRCHLSCYVRFWFHVPQKMREFFGDKFADAVSGLMSSGEWIELPDITSYHTQVKSVRAEVGHFKNEFRELEYILYRVLSNVRRLGIGDENFQNMLKQTQDWLLTARMVQSAALYIATGTPLGLAMGGVTGLSIIAQLGAMGQENWQNLQDSIARERQHQLELAQIEIRRRRY